MAALGRVPCLIATGSYSLSTVPQGSGRTRYGNPEMPRGLTDRPAWIWHKLIPAPPRPFRCAPPPHALDRHSANTWTASTPGWKS